MRPGPQVSHRRPAHIKQGCGDVEAALPSSRGDWGGLGWLWLPWGCKASNYLFDTLVDFW